MAIVRIGVKLEMQDATAVADRLCYEEFAETRSQARVGVTAMEARLLMADFFPGPWRARRASSRMVLGRLVRVVQEWAVIKPAYPAFNADASERVPATGRQANAGS